MSTNFQQMQTLLDEWGQAITRRDLNRVLMLRKTIDGKLAELCKRPIPPAPGPTAPSPRPQFRPPPSPPRAAQPKRPGPFAPPTPPNTRFTPKRPEQVREETFETLEREGVVVRISCQHCKGTGRFEEGNAILRCRECNGDGYNLKVTDQL